MLDWYKKNLNNNTYFDDDNNMVAFVIEKNTDTEIKKYKHKKPLPKKTDNLERFIVNKYENTIRKIKFIENTEMFPLGLYFLHNTDHDHLFFIFPNEKTSFKGIKRIFGGHFSFMHDKNDKNTPNHFHITIYKPYLFMDNVGDIEKQENYLQDNIVLPLKNYDCDIFDSIVPYDKASLDICRINTNKQTGSGKGKTRVISKKTNNKTMSNKLENLLTHEKIQRLFAIGFYKNEQWNFTTFVDREEQEEEEEEEDEDDEDEDGLTDSGDNNYIFSYSFVTKTKGYNVFENKLIQIIEKNISE
jgi:hypothetical protein